MITIFGSLRVQFNFVWFRLSSVSALFGFGSAKLRLRFGSASVRLGFDQFRFDSLSARFSLGSVSLGFASVWFWSGLVSARLGSARFRLGCVSVSARFGFV